MNKRELIEAVAARADLPRKQVEDTVNALLDTVGETMRSGESVQLTGFGTFEPRDRAARTGQNPRTGEAVRIPATTAPAFRAGQPLKDLVGQRSAKKAGKKAAGKKAGKKAAGKKTAKTAGKKTVKKAGKKTVKRAAKKR